MPSLFIDANVFFSATYSKTGASRALFRLSEKGLVQLVSSTYALHEARVNIEKKIGEDALAEFLKLVSLLVRADRNESIKDMFRELINSKDLPILCSAYRQKVDFLVTLGRKDFMSSSMKKTVLPFQIVTPGEFLSGL